MRGDWGLVVRADGGRTVVPLGPERRRSWWGPVLLLAVLAMLFLEGCCPDLDRWFLTLHCEDGAHVVECGSRPSCEALADAVFQIGTACTDGSIGSRGACE